jgi:hypothetical protein
MQWLSANLAGDVASELSSGVRKCRGFSHAKVEINAAFDDLLLQTPKSLHTFAIDQRHVDIKDAKQTVCPVLRPLRFVFRGPLHLDGYRGLI